MLTSVLDSNTCSGIIVYVNVNISFGLKYFEWDNCYVSEWNIISFGNDSLEYFEWDIKFYVNVTSVSETIHSNTLSRIIVYVNVTSVSNSNTFSGIIVYVNVISFVLKYVEWLYVNVTSVSNSNTLSGINVYVNVCCISFELNNLSGNCLCKCYISFVYKSGGFIIVYLNVTWFV
jgi:hypothetical protein